MFLKRRWLSKIKSSFNPGSGLFSAIVFVEGVLGRGRLILLIILVARVVFAAGGRGICLLLLLLLLLPSSSFIAGADNCPQTVRYMILGGGRRAETTRVPPC